MKKILVSACLMGENCRYKGDNCKNDKVLALSNEGELIPVCPETLGGLPTPRLPGEIVGDRVLASNGDDITEQYVRGARLALDVARRNDVSLCVLKANSPSCGKGRIYDGTFSGTKTEGNGVTARLLLQEGFKVITEEEL